MVTAGLITAAPLASAGCINPDWAGHPLAQMCGDPVLGTPPTHIDP
jgi:hypothetical protein